LEIIFVDQGVVSHTHSDVTSKFWHSTVHWCIVGRLFQPSIWLFSPLLFCSSVNLLVKVYC